MFELLIVGKGQVMVSEPFGGALAPLALPLDPPLPVRLSLFVCLRVDRSHVLVPIADLSHRRPALYSRE